MFNEIPVLENLGIKRNNKTVEAVQKWTMQLNMAVEK